jgi:linoleoyl-CoA desaturase
VSKLNIVRFAPKNGEGFFDTLKKNIDQYFKENNAAPHGNASLRWKSVAMISLFFVPLTLIITGVGAASPFLFFGLWFLVGLGMIGVGCGVHHDSNHGSYSSNKTVNKVVGDVVNLVGGYDVTWRIQHNILHHTYTNIDGLDDDIDTGGLMRISPNVEKLKIHRYQHIYGWFLYSLLTLQWVTYKDFRLLFVYEKRGLLKKEKITLRKALLELSIYKIIYFGITIVLPIMYSGMSWQACLMGFMVLHFTAGLGLACIFQLAHVLESSDYAVPSDDRKMENSWAIHQLMNTANFSPTSHWFFWFVGGLNYQVEHHLFPHISHVHYPQISKIVKQTAEQYNLPYKVMPTFANALKMHYQMLRKLGRE